MRLVLELEIALEHFLRRSRRSELAEVLQVRQALEEQDALDQLVGVLHLVDRLVVLVVAEPVEPQFLIMRACRKYWLIAVSSLLASC